MKHFTSIAFLLLVLLFTLNSFAGIPDTVITPADEFLSVDSFQSFTNDLQATDSSSGGFSTTSASHTENSGGLLWTLAILGFTITAGVLVRFKNARYFRSLFLVASLILLGFYRGGCPCSISSLQHTAFLIMGNPVKWHSIVLFVGLIPITYLFGRVFCGWICQLGALQEFIFASSRFKFFQGIKAQHIMRRMRMVALTALLIQLLITHTNLYKIIDPFATIYSFYSLTITGWILAGILLVSSAFIYRPFCKTICPVGLMLGWISKIPGASILAQKQNCISCSNCSNLCKIRAITHDDRTTIFQNEECIRCGECIGGCKRNAIGFSKMEKSIPINLLLDKQP